jgi:hypothetical protein
MPLGDSTVLRLNAIAAIPALTDDQCSAVAGFPVVGGSLLLLRSPAVAGVHILLLAKLLLLASLLWIPCCCLHPCMMLVASLMFPVVVVGKKIREI